MNDAGTTGGGIAPRFGVWLGLIGALHVLAGPVAAEPIDPFVGRYEGESVSDARGLLAAGDIGLRIRREGQGFLADWRSTVSGPEGVQRSNHEVFFEPIRERPVYRAHGQPGVSGQLRSADPMRGEPYFWARLEGATLILYAMRIEPAGSLDLRIYRYGLAGARTSFAFRHLRDGLPVSDATGWLRRHDDSSQ